MVQRKIAILSIIVAAAALAACSSTPKEGPDRQEASAKLVEKNIPDWFNTPSESSSAYKAVGDGVSGSLSGALSNARTAAFEGICQSAGSMVRSQNKQFRQDTGSASTSVNTSVTRNFCPDVDVSGAVVEKQQIFRDGSRFRAFVLVRLDKGASSAKAVNATADKEFKELDKLNAEFKKQ